MAERNRGCLHEGHEMVREWRLRAWITCRLSFRARRVAQLDTRLHADDPVMNAAAGQDALRLRHPAVLYRARADTLGEGVAQHHP